MKVGIFGGTFNPVHNGHVNLAVGFQEQLRLDRVELIPANAPPHKEAADLAGGADRLAMLELAFSGRPDFFVSGRELRRGGASYTVETLEQYRREHPDWTLYLIIGEDMLFSFHQWYRYDRILELARLSVAQRAGRERTGEMRRYASEVLQLSRDAYDVGEFEQVVLSSSGIRARIRAGQPIRNLVPEAVADYIEEKGLYRGVSD
ncbi:MAG: nicotinate-nucleotide adenylyltransferase [Clostridiales bacterium]|nr:nicotinate-nucleotide adenylyltransferase [Clostridiales bacterium]